jgi:8-oxo-dGTP diphosphatase
MEETGLEIENIHFLTATNDVMLAEGKHYVTVFVGGIIKDPKTMPEVCQ